MSKKKYDFGERFFVTMIESKEGRNGHYSILTNAIQNLLEWYPPENHKIDEVFQYVNIAGKLASVAQLITLAQMYYKKK